MSSSTEKQIMPSVITTFCCTNWALWHMPNYFESICIQRSACDILSKKWRLLWKSHLASRAAWAQPLNSGHMIACDRITPKIHHLLSLTSPCPLIFHVLWALRLSNFISAPSLSFTSSFPSSPLFISCLFHLISGSLLQGAEASLLSTLADVSSIIILKAF